MLFECQKNDRCSLTFQSLLLFMHLSYMRVISESEEMISEGPTITNYNMYNEDKSINTCIFCMTTCILKHTSTP